MSTCLKYLDEYDLSMTYALGDDFDPEREAGIEAYLTYLLSVGALQERINEKGEIIYNQNPEILKQISPLLYEHFMKEVDEALIELYKNGLVEVEYDENLQAKFTLKKE